MPDANRPKPVAPRSATAPPVDPRVALAQKYLRSAETKLTEEEAAKPRCRKTAEGSRSPAGFAFSVTGATGLHVILAAIALTFDALVLTLCYHMLMVNFTVGRVIALPAGVLTAAIWAYISVCYLGIIESTSIGNTNVDSLQGDWQEWFWTLPTSVGMLAIAAGIGWGFSLAFPINVWWLIAISVVLAYPILQLSSLETGSPLAPLSLPVVRSLIRHPVAWFVVYAISFAVVDVTWALSRLAWKDPPYSTILIMGPIVTVALFFYAWLLGQLARIISSEEKS